MNVIVPFANEGSVEFKATMLNLQIQKVPAEWRRMKTDTSYAEYFNELWARGHTFIIVEHDVLPWPGALEELWLCPSTWCGFSTSLQCTKFDPSALGECPVPLDTHWQHVDKLQFELGYRFTNGKPGTPGPGRGFEFHEHSPNIVHLNREGCV